MLPLPTGQTPRAWQLAALQAVRAALVDFDAVLISAATGTGKGSLIAGIAILTALRGNRVLLLAHRDELIEELVARIRKVPGAPGVGVVKASRNEWLNPIVVASVQSLTPKRRKQMGRFGLVLTDEAHHALAPGYLKIYEAVAEGNADWKHIGFTATPFRSAADGGTSGLGKVFQGIAFTYGIQDAIANGDLVPIRAFNVSTEVSLEGLRTGADGDFVEEDLAKLIDTPARNELVAREYLARCPGQPALVFCASIEHAVHMAEAFVARGVRAKAVWGDMPGTERRDLVQLYRERPDILPVLCSKDLIFEGFDAPATRAVLKARPTKSRVVFTQMVGRGLRLHPGKDECIFLDFVDNGCDLDLATISDLADEDPQERTARPLDVGDRVRRRHHDDWGTGTILRVEEREHGNLAEVEWPPSRVRTLIETVAHPVRDLKRAPAEEEEVREGEAIVIHPKVKGVQVYEVFLLPGQSATSRTAVGWYEYQGAWVAAGKFSDRSRLIMHVAASGARWGVWGVRTPPPARLGIDEDVVTMLHVSASREAGIAWADAHLKSQGATVAPISADWKAHPATGNQRSALKRWGILRDTSKMSSGEASALLDAVAAHKKVRQSGRRAQGAA